MDLAAKTQSFGNEILINQKGLIYIKFPELKNLLPKAVNIQVKLIELYYIMEIWLMFILKMN